VKQGEPGNTLATMLGYGAPPSMCNVPPPPIEVAPDHGWRNRSRLLVVEDNAMNQEVALAVLNALGYRHIQLACNGSEAVSALGREDFDLVLMDCQMPQMDGYAATRAVRDPKTRVRHHDVPIVAMTAHASEADRRKCLESGMNDYLSKPINIAQLERLLDRHLGAGAAASSYTVSIREAEQTASPVFDRHDLLSRVMGNSQMAKRIVARFVSDMPRQLLALSVALESGDSSKVRMAAHSIKGAAANVGGARLRQRAREIEERGAEGYLEQCADLLPDLNTEWETFRAETEVFLAGG
jgi:CheY-like chemotaxis protein